MGSYSVHVKRSAAKEIEALPRKDRARIIERIRILAEDVEDLAAIEARAKEPSMPFEEFVKDLKRRGKL